MNKGQNQLSRIAVTLKNEDECNIWRLGQRLQHKYLDWDLLYEIEFGWVVYWRFWGLLKSVLQIFMFGRVGYHKPSQHRPFASDHFR